MRIRISALLLSLMTASSCARGGTKAPDTGRPSGLPETRCGPVWVPDFTEDPERAAEDAPHARAQGWVSAFAAPRPDEESHRGQFSLPNGNEYTFELVQFDGPGCQYFAVELFVWRKDGSCYAVASFDLNVQEVRAWVAEGAETVLIEADASVYDPKAWTRSRKSFARELPVVPTSEAPRRP